MGEISTPGSDQSFWNPGWKMPVPGKKTVSNGDVDCLIAYISFLARVSNWSSSASPWSISADDISSEGAKVMTFL